MTEPERPQPSQPDPNATLRARLERLAPEQRTLVAQKITALREQLRSASPETIRQVRQQLQVTAAPGQTVKGPGQNLADFSDYAPRAPARSTRRRWLTAAAATAAVAGGTLAIRGLRTPPTPARPEAKPTPQPTYTPEPTPPPAPPRRPDESRGNFYGKHFENFKDRDGKYPEVIDGETNTPLPHEHLGSVFGAGFEILGYGPRLGTFLVASFPSPLDRSRKQYIVSQASVHIETPEFEPLKEVKLKEGLGINLNEKDSLHYALAFGASAVRINLDEGKPEDLEKFKKDIEEAKKLGIKLNILFQPHKPEDPSVLHERLDSIFALLGDYQNVGFELGNEPDAGDYWENNNLETFAEFVKVSSDHIQKKRGSNTQIIVAALIQRDLKPFEELLTHLQRKNVRLSDLHYGLHAYQEVADVTLRLSYLLPALERRGIRNSASRVVATEIGTQLSKNHLFPMLERLRNFGIKESYIFSLVDPDWFSARGHEGFGFIYRLTSTGDTNWYGRSTDYYLLQQFIQTLPSTANERTYDTLNKSVK